MNNEFSKLYEELEKIENEYDRIHVENEILRDANKSEVDTIIASIDNTSPLVQQIKDSANKVAEYQKMVDESARLLAKEIGCPFKSAFMAEIFEDVINNYCNGNVIGGMCDSEYAQVCWKQRMKCK